MGQKVQPLGFRRSAYKKRLGFPSLLRNEAATGKKKPSLLTLSYIRGSFEYGPRPEKGTNSYSKKLHEDFIIENIVEEFFKKSGYIVSTLNIYRNFKELQIFVEICPLSPSLHKAKLTPRQGFFQSTKGLKKQNEKGSLGLMGHSHKVTDEAKNLDLEVDVLTNFLENFVSSKVSIIRKNVLFSKTPTLYNENPFSSQSDLGTIKNVGEVNTTTNFSIFLSKALKNYRKEFFFTNGINMLDLTFQRPNASLLAKFMALTLEDLPKGQTFIDFIGQGLGALFQNLSQQQTTLSLSGKNIKIKGILVKVKGRINGSDRSRTSTYRYGSIPLHTIKAAIDYGYSFTKSSYGVSSIKVWFFVE